MPLLKSGSEKAFVSNLKRELSAGKPKKQALAIAYSVKRKSGGGGETMESYAKRRHQEIARARRPNRLS